MDKGGMAVYARYIAFFSILVAQFNTISRTRLIRFEQMRIRVNITRPEAACLMKTR